MTLLTVDQLATRWAIHQQTVYKALRGELKVCIPKPFRVGGRIRFREEDILALEGRTNEPNQPSPAPEHLLAAETGKRRGRPRNAFKNASEAL